MSKPRIKIELIHHGPVTEHNLMCWECNERPAVYHMNPVWVFGPCWECDKEIGGYLLRSRSKLLRSLLK